MPRSACSPFPRGRSVDAFANGSGQNGRRASSQAVSAIDRPVGASSGARLRAGGPAGAGAGAGVSDAIMRTQMSHRRIVQHRPDVSQAWSTRRTPLRRLRLPGAERSSLKPAAFELFGAAAVLLDADDSRETVESAQLSLLLSLLSQVQFGAVCSVAVAGRPTARGSSATNPLLARARDDRRLSAERRVAAMAPPPFDAGDCKNPVCGSKMEMFGRALRGASSTASAHAETPRACPVDREELGRGTWDLLHTTAAYYPDAPDAAARAGAASLVAGLAATYPCEHCRDDFKDAVASAPPALGSRAAFSLWVCRQHNVVNAKLGKPAFDCALAALDERWRDGAPGCWGADDATAAESLGRAEPGA
mmetsp:Transcript_28039/g.84304  ORF Transcript_28039/g.84304 Transcript_28039/m.84304 type:complete len:363 (-) Transcript_28039:36-1124(-)